MLYRIITFFCVLFITTNCNSFDISKHAIDMRERVNAARAKAVVHLAKYHDNYESIKRDFFDLFNCEFNYENVKKLGALDTGVPMLIVHDAYDFKEFDELTDSFFLYTTL